MRLSVSPAKPFSDASLPNHTKMFELVHVVTAMGEFGFQFQHADFYICTWTCGALLAASEGYVYLMTVIYSVFSFF
jgi:hypothetical protein